MTYTATATQPEPSADAVHALPGQVLLEFGTDWCPHCTGAQAAIRTVLAPREDIAHTKIEDGPGRRLGRHFRVKLWPTLVLLQDGQEVARTVRPRTPEDVQALLPAR